MQTWKNFSENEEIEYVFIKVRILEFRYDFLMSLKLLEFLKKKKISIFQSLNSLEKLSEKIPISQNSKFRVFDP